MKALDEQAWRVIFGDARTHNGWQEKPVEDALLHILYAILRMGPTAMNSQPMRVVFVKGADAKARLKPTLSPGNVDKTMAAPVTAIIAYDTEFYEKMGKLAPQFPNATNTLSALEPAIREQMASLSATLQAGYLIVTARGLGLDCGPMGGFERAQVDSAFFPDGRWKSLLLVNLGYGDPSKLYPRAPRLDFDEACTVL